ncbi:hypothetical protein ALNOE001_02290 [Candidatus Methanobinarius endosymbioticus]|uniref:Uncharacterized protein n=1 Tax=Candidatus Methanobinarius endosymbioticus TaxID=2006182 RepID=A0A366MDQ7_9EURY|nr:hypothetical protein ALNOE001_02290 [Candidatus Methanobinarius endosymbioticus]
MVIDYDIFYLIYFIFNLIYLIYLHLFLFNFIYNKNPFITAVLSFFLLCLGQFYHGQILKGILFMLIAIVLRYVNGIIGFLFILYAIYDAYKNAKQINQNNGNYFHDENLKNGNRV